MRRQTSWALVALSVSLLACAPAIAAGAAMSAASAPSYALAVEALAYPDGTRVTLHLMDRAGAPAAAEAAEHVLVKTKGSQAVLHNARGPIALANGDLSADVRALPGGTLVSAEMNVRAPDGKRMEVVRANAPVRLAPALALIDLTGPAEAKEGVPLTFTALVGEDNREASLQVDLGLYEGERLLDRATGVTIPAGGRVSVAFAAALDGAGEHLLHVRALDAAPALYAEPEGAPEHLVTVSAAIERAPFTYRMSYLYAEDYRLTWSWQQGTDWSVEGFSGSVETLSFHGVLPGAGPLTHADLAFLADGAEKERVALSAAPGGLTYAAPDGHLLVQVVPDGDNHLVSVYRFAGSLVFHSQGFTSYWGAFDRSQSFELGPLLAARDRIALDVTLSGDGPDAPLHGGVAELDLAPLSLHTSWAACDDPSSCSSLEYHVTGFSGSIEGATLR